MQNRRELSKVEIENTKFLINEIKQGKCLELYSEPTEIMWEIAYITFESEQNNFKIQFTDGCFDAATPSRLREINPVYKTETELQTFLNNYAKYWDGHYSAEILFP